MTAQQIPLYVRLGAAQSQRLERAVALSGKSKRQIIEDAVRDHLDDQGLEVGRIALRETPPDVLTLEEAASFLRVSPEALRAAVADGTVPARQIGGEWRFARQALLAWLGQP
jgi:excisionase family DNA binding protein